MDASVTPRADNKKAKEAVAQSVLAPVVEFLRRHAPFDEMASSHIDFLAQRLELKFYAHGELITSPDAGPALRFYIIKQGHVRGEPVVGGAPASVWELDVGECFPVGALLARRSVVTELRAVEDTFCFELPRADFDELVARSHSFRDFCTRRLASLLDQALSQVKADLASEAAGETALNTPLVELMHREPVSCHANATLGQALTAMRQNHVGSIVVTDSENVPIGIFTVADLLRLAEEGRVDRAQPIDSVMTPRPSSLTPRHYAYEAALCMAREGCRHIVIVDNNRLVGVLSERDLFANSRVGLVRLVRAIGLAKSLDRLAELSRDVHGVVDKMLVHGASVGQLMQIITELNDNITRRIITLCLQETPEPLPPFTWLAFGSEGRQEQTLKTDQDNGILFELREGESADDVRARLLPVARRINEALDRCGYPLCTGNIMASNPECCLSAQEWRERFRRWIDLGGPAELLRATIFFDFRPLYGDKRPVAALRQWTAEHVRGNRRFLRQLAENALSHQPPLGVMRDFILSDDEGHRHSLDLKIRGIGIFVAGARVFALASGASDTSTLKRLGAAAQRGAISTDECKAWSDAYVYLQVLRMRQHQQQFTQGLPLDNFLDPDSLSELERRILKEAFRQGRKLQARLALDYQL